MAERRLIATVRTRARRCSRCARPTEAKTCPVCHAETIALGAPQQRRVVLGTSPTR